MNRPKFNYGLDRYSGLYLWAFFIIVFCIWKPHLFPTLSTWHSIAASNSIEAMVAIAVLFPLTAGLYDLSVGAVTNLSAIVVVVLQNDFHMEMWLAILVAIAVSVMTGVLNGFFVVVLGINSFIATLAMATILSAVQVIITGANQPLPIVTRSFVDLTQRTVFGFQIVFVYLIALGLIVWWVLAYTPMGRYLYAVGSDPESARMSGINVAKWSWRSLVISAGLCGVAGVLYASNYGPDLTFGQTLLLPAFAAVFLGSTQLHPGRFNVWGTLLAVYALATGVRGLQLVTGVQWLGDMFSGVALLAAVGFAVWRQKVRVDRDLDDEVAEPLATEPALPV